MNKEEKIRKVAREEIRKCEHGENIVDALIEAWQMGYDKCKGEEK